MSTFDSGQPYRYSAQNQIIPGWKESIQMLKKGGKGKFLIPSHLAHGSRGAGHFYPPNTVLVYDIEVVELEERQRRDQRQNEKDQQLIAEYLGKVQLKTQQTPEGVHYLIEKEGSSPHPSKQSKVRIRYTGSFLDGSVFSSSSQQPLEGELADLGNTLPFWSLIVPLLKKGGKGKFIIPSHLAFGDREVGTIPANSILVFDLELLEIVD